MSISSSHNDSSSLIYALVGGPIVLGWGLRKLNQKRLLQNTPTSKVRSAAMGVVELSGLARQQKPQKAPLSNFDACWWNCRVQELRSNGKSSSWYTIKQTGSHDLFYLEDTTGRVLINPFGAEMNVLSVPYELNASTRTKISTVLRAWGINDMNWFGGEKRMRIIEEVIPDCAPLYIMGELITFGNEPLDRKARFMARLRAIKADRAQMAEVDTDKDGTVDAEEWAAFTAVQEEEFLKEEMSRQVNMPNEATMMVKAPANGLFMISTKEERDLVNSMSWLAPLAILGGMVLCVGGVWVALLIQWSPLLIVGALAVGAVLSFLRKTLNFELGRN